jgi:hypothetical protein
MTVQEKRRAAPVTAPERITITVGVHGDDGAQVHEPPPKKTQAPANDTTLGPANDVRQALTVADIARFHEFGLGVPQRSFIRAWFDEQQPFIVQTLQQQMALVVAGKLTAEKAAARIALAFEGDMKKRIAKGIGPPLAKSTIARKGSSKPLIHTGQLRNAIRARAEVGSASGELGSGGGGGSGAEAAE